MYNLLSTKPDVNDIVDFAFWPAQSSTLAECTHNTSDPGKSYLCQIDLYEACALETLGCVGGCGDAKTQLQLFNFLNCFEGQHVTPTPGKDYPDAAWLDALAPCATKAYGAATHAKVEKCASGGIASGDPLNKAWSAIGAFVSASHNMFFPWVTVAQGPMMEGYDDCLLHAVCGNYTGKEPQDCANQPAPPKGC